ncbi:MAG TPA: iron chelate uptake ABC transporter family permease subunit, partial [Solirubrobacterales bacterium]|nr:iron chelate uptake ABC transporter family permease subunit [Solirubrobacterales bacterium]
MIDTLLGQKVPEASRQIIEVLRLPRTVEAIVVGAALGVAGACLQGALNNPLASPDVIGVTAGAGFGAMLVLLFSPASVALLPISALAFGLIAAAMVFLIGFTGRGGGNITRIILAGIAIAALFSAATAGLLSAYPDRVPNAVFFLVGGLTSSDGWDTLETIWPYLAVGFVIAAGLQAALLAVGGRTADHRGRKPALTIGLAVGLVSLIVLALAPNTGWFLIAMAVAGVSGAFLGPSPTAIVGDVARGHHGGSVVAGFQMMSDVGSIIGPMVAGLLLDELASSTAEAAAGRTALLLLGLPVAFLSGRDLAAFPARIGWLFNYDYVNVPGTGRPWPLVSQYGERYEYGLPLY